MVDPINPTQVYGDGPVDIKRGPGLVALDELGAQIAVLSKAKALPSVARSFSTLDGGDNLDIAALVQEPRKQIVAHSLNLYLDQTGPGHVFEVADADELDRGVKRLVQRKAYPMALVFL